ncbi:hypothetical protein E2C01_032797 [Portunus trituberculatus]|uniref:Uncharacterized protein n=1 Tax=Portunus trituberculatus TaxID=210409 RepID=A0A5B7F254_PORTR|nr:hypothetical protein [Portunus trituberculatus]
MASKRSIFSRRSMASLLSTWSTMFMLVVRDGEPPYPSTSASPLQRGDSRPPPDPPDPPEPTLLRLGNSASSIPSRSSSSSSSLLSSSSSPFLSGDSSLVEERRRSSFLATLYEPSSFSRSSSLSSRYLRDTSMCEAAGGTESVLQGGVACYSTHQPMPLLCCCCCTFIISIVTSPHHDTPPPPPAGHGRDFLHAGTTVDAVTAAAAAIPTTPKRALIPAITDVCSDILIKTYCMNANKAKGVIKNPVSHDTPDEASAHNALIEHSQARHAV